MIGALLLAGCGSSGSSESSASGSSSASASGSASPSGSASSSTSASPSSSAAPTGEAGYVAFLIAAGGITDEASKQNLLEVGRTVCKGFDEGNTVVQIYNAMLDAKYTKEQAATLITVAVKFICPQYTSQLPTPSPSPSAS
jgi:hypothetical protein